MFCVRDVTKLRLRYLPFRANGRSFGEQEYPAKALEIIVLTLTKTK